MKLYLTLEDDDGQKVERVVVSNKENGFDLNDIDDIMWSMFDSLRESKKPL